MSAYRRHCADSAAESRSDAFDAWNERVDLALYAHHISPAAYTRDERFAAFNEFEDAEDCAESFAASYYEDAAADGACDECTVCGGCKPLGLACGCDGRKDCADSPF